MEAFYNCDAITSVTIPNSVTSIGERAFMYCRDITEVYCYATTPPKLGQNKSHFDDDIRYNSILYVPERCGSVYKASGWGKYYFRDIVEME